MFIRKRKERRERGRLEYVEGQAGLSEEYTLYWWRRWRWEGRLSRPPDGIGFIDKFHRDRTTNPRPPMPCGAACCQSEPAHAPAAAAAAAANIPEATLQESAVENGTGTTSQPRYDDVGPRKQPQQHLQPLLQNATRHKHRNLRSRQDVTAWALPLLQG